MFLPQIAFELSGFAINRVQVHLLRQRVLNAA